MVLHHGPPHPPPQHLPAPARLQQEHTKPLPLPRHRLRAVHGYLLAIYPAAAVRVIDVEGPGRAFLLASRLWLGHPLP